MGWINWEARIICGGLTSLRHVTYLGTPDCCTRIMSCDCWILSVLLRWVLSLMTHTHSLIQHCTLFLSLIFSLRLFSRNFSLSYLIFADHLLRQLLLIFSWVLSKDPSTFVLIGQFCSRLNGWVSICSDGGRSLGNSLIYERFVTFWDIGYVCEEICRFRVVEGWWSSNRWIPRIWGSIGLIVLPYDLLVKIEKAFDIVKLRVQPMPHSISSWRSLLVTCSDPFGSSCWCYLRVCLV